MLLAMNFIFTVACLYTSTNLHSRLISNERFEVKIYVCTVYDSVQYN